MTIERFNLSRLEQLDVGPLGHIVSCLDSRSLILCTRVSRAFSEARIAVVAPIFEELKSFVEKVKGMPDSNINAEQRESLNRISLSILRSPDRMKFEISNVLKTLDKEHLNKIVPSSSVGQNLVAISSRIVEASSLEDEEARANELRAISKTIADAGDINWAINFAVEIPYQLHRYQEATYNLALLDICRRIVHFGNIHWAIELASCIPEGQSHQHAHSMIFKALLKKKEFSWASDVTNLYPIEGYRDDALLEICRACITENDFPAAILYAKKISSEWSRKCAIEEVFDALIAKKEFSQASEMADLELSEVDRDEILLNLSKARADEMDFEGAFDDANKILLVGIRRDALEKLRQALVVVGDDEGAAEVSEEMDGILPGRNHF